MELRTAKRASVRGCEILLLVEVRRDHRMHLALGAPHPLRRLLFDRLAREPPLDPLARVRMRLLGGEPV